VSELRFVPAAPDPVWQVERIDHPILPLWIACEGERLAAVTMGERSSLDALARRRRAQLSAAGERSPAATQIHAYLHGQRQVFSLELVSDPGASDFEREAWAALCRIPFGETRSYGEQARMIAKPGAARAVGRANARSPIAIVVPCHRIIGADGKLTGFAGGLANKRWLLAHEGVRVASEAGPAMPAPANQLGFEF